MRKGFWLLSSGCKYRTYYINHTELFLFLLGQFNLYIVHLLFNLCSPAQFCLYDILYESLLRSAYHFQLCTICYRKTLKKLSLFLT